jgi:hypothetical protein
MFGKDERAGECLALSDPTRFVGGIALLRDSRTAADAKSFDTWKLSGKLVSHLIAQDYKT